MKITRTQEQIEDFIWKNCCPDYESGCLVWFGVITKKGYPKIGWNDKIYTVTRLIMHLYHDFDLDSSLQIHHKCYNRSCIEPDHLQILSNKDNCQDAADKGNFGSYCRNKTHCPAGHVYNTENTYIDSKGYRQCRACKREYMRRYKK